MRQRKEERETEREKEFSDAGAFFSRQSQTGAEARGPITLKPSLLLRET